MNQPNDKQRQSTAAHAVEAPCNGCGKPLLLENAWMYDGCPCNTPDGVNDSNLYRWRLLWELQQADSRRAEKAERESAAKQAQIDRLMLEFCPDEMTEEQCKTWAEHQRSAGPEASVALDHAARSASGPSAIQAVVEACAEVLGHDVIFGDIPGYFAELRSDLAKAIANHSADLSSPSAIGTTIVPPEVIEAAEWYAGVPAKIGKMSDFILKLATTDSGAK